jgi:membrane-associated PAP2 superfamily phosphatase
VLIVVGFAVVIAVYAFDPGLDLRITSDLFFDEAAKKFWLADHPVIVSLRNLNSAIDIMIGVVLAFGVIYAWLVPSKAPPISRRTIVFLVATFLLAPVLVANGVFKEHWSRPRPYHVVEYGGAAPFVQWWDPRGVCKRSCSFFSGEVSAAAWTMAPAVLVPGIMGAVAIAASLVFTAMIAVVRMAQGGHFFSDAAFAALITWLIVWLAYGIYYRRRPAAKSSAPEIT